MDCSLGGCSILDFDDGSTETRMENLEIPTTRSGFTTVEPDLTERQFYQFIHKPQESAQAKPAQTKRAQAKPAPVQASPVPVTSIPVAPVLAPVAPVQTNAAPVSAAGYFSNYFAANPYQYQPYQQNPYYLYQPYMYNYWPQSSWGWGRKKRSAQQGNLLEIRMKHTSLISCPTIVN